jgi:hypothetical protein
MNSKPLSSGHRPTPSRVRRLALAAPLLLGLSPAVTRAAPADIPVLAPRPEDVSSIDGLMRAFYAVVNVRPNEPRQWGRDRTLYRPGTRFLATSTGKDGRPVIEDWDHTQLVSATEPLVQRGFAEREIYRRTRVYGHMAHVDSSYETELAAPGGVLRSRGVNSIEMVHDGQRWWIAAVMWMTESPQAPIPLELLPPAQALSK